MDADVKQSFQGLEKQLDETDKQLGMEAMSDALLSPDAPPLRHVAWLRMMAKYCDVLDVDTRWRLAAVAIDYERMKRTLDELVAESQEDVSAAEQRGEEYCRLLNEGIAAERILT